MAVDVFTDTFERLSEADIFTQGPSSPMFIEGNVWLDSASTREVQYGLNEPSFWSEPSPTATQNLFSHSSEPINHFIHGDNSEPLLNSKSVLDPATRKTDDQLRSAEPKSLLSSNHIYQSDNKLHVFQSDLGSAKDPIDQQYPYLRSKHEASSTQPFAPSTSQSTSDNGSNLNALRRRKSHNEIEKRYRSSLNDRFRELENVLEDSHTRGNEVDETTQNSKRASRIDILAQARDEILALREQVGTLEGKIESLRKLAFPATYKYTRRNT